MQTTQSLKKFFEGASSSLTDKLIYTVSSVALYSAIASFSSTKNAFRFTHTVN